MGRLSSDLQISVVLLTHNEECNVRNALESVRWCQEVVVIDSFSTDQTEAICRGYSNVVFVQNPFHNLAAQRQYAIDEGLVSASWVLALDADEVVSGDLAQELQQIAKEYQPGKAVAYDIAMRYIMWGKWLKYSSEYPVYWRRFFRVDSVRYVQQGHADKVVVDGPVGSTFHDLLHEDHHDLAHWLAKHNRYSTQEAEYALGELSKVSFREILARDRAQRRKALKRLFRSLPMNDFIRFVYLFVWRWGFLDGRPGWKYCRLKSQQAYHVSLKMEELLCTQDNGKCLS